MDTFLIFLGMALVTYFTRVTMVVALGREMPPLLRRWLRYVPSAVLAALIAPAIMAPQGQLEVGLPTLAALAGAVAAWRTRSVWWTLVVGMAVFWALRLLGL
jgi:branched-subunit amino acid transport protein